MKLTGLRESTKFPSVKKFWDFKIPKAHNQGYRDSSNCWEEETPQPAELPGRPAQSSWATAFIVLTHAGLGFLVTRLPLDHPASQKQLQ